MVPVSKDFSGGEIDAVTVFVTLAMQHGGRLAVDQTTSRSGTGMGQDLKIVRVTVEIPEEAEASFKMITGGEEMTFDEDDFPKPVLSNY